MRELTSEVLDHIAVTRGQKPVIHIEIGWIAGQGRARYSETDFGDFKAKILQVNSIDEIIKISEGGSSTSVSVVLDDTDGSIKNILDNNDIHKRPVWIYQWFKGTPDADKFLIFRGEIRSPIAWDEGSRNVSFDVVSRLEDAEIGFSIEEGQFPLLPPDLVGEPWPLAFGHPIHVPALRVTSPREGTLAEGFGIRDYTLEYRITLADAICCPNTYAVSEEPNPRFNSGTPPQPGFWGSQYIGNTLVLYGDLATDYSPPVNTEPQFIPVMGPDPRCLSNKCEIREELQFQLNQQKQFEFTSVNIIGGEKFVQNKTIVLNIGGAYVRGSFNGSVFQIQKRYHPDTVPYYGQSPNSADISLIKNNGSTRKNLGTFGTRGEIDKTIAEKFREDRGPASINSNCLAPGKDNADCQADSLDSLNSFPTAEFAWINQGARVTYAYDEEVVYIANILPSDVKCVAAYRNLGFGKRVLLIVPEDYYTTRISDYGSYQVTEVVFNRPLSLEADGWEDDIYVTMVEDTVGSNTIDQLIWLIETYTDFGINGASFNPLRDKLANYPSDFAFLERKNILNALEEMAFQARCAIWLREDRFYIKYLAEEPEIVGSIVQSDVLQNTLQITHTPADELVTKLRATWTDSYAAEAKTLILRNNIERYGTHEENYDFYIYNRFELVEKSAIFWLIRKSNTWRKLRFKGVLTKLATETYDSMTITLPDFTPEPVTGMVEQATYDTVDNSIDFELWTGVRSGEQAEYPWAHPATAPSGLLWPPEEEQSLRFAPGGAPGSFVIPPVGHPLSGAALLGNGDIVESISCSNRPPSSDLEYCCQSPDFFLSGTEVCGRYQPRRLDDSNDKYPNSLTPESCPGAVNLGKEPKFNDGRDPIFKVIKKGIDKAMSTAAKANDAATQAGGGGGGGGGGDPFPKKKPDKDENPWKNANLPPKTSGGQTSTPPGQPPICTGSITLSWFGTYTGACACGTCHFPLPGSATTETFEFACSGDTPTGGASSDFSKMVSAVGAASGAMGGFSTGENSGILGTATGCNGEVSIGSYIITECPPSGSCTPADNPPGQMTGYNTTNDNTGSATTGGANSPAISTALGGE